MGEDLFKMVVLIISYQGDAFYGIQYQKDFVTVCSELASALEKIVCHKIEFLIAGRTDAGVHATGQVVSFLTNVNRPSEAFLCGANNFLSKSIRIDRVFFLNPNFHPRFDAVARRYTYLIYREKNLPCHWVGKATAVGCALDLVLMKKLALTLYGENDFASFRASGCQSKSTMRNLHFIDFYENDEWLMISLQANAFLYRMVRKMVRSFIYVGSGYWSEEDWLSFVSLKNKNLPPMDAGGLYLTKVIYDQNYELLNRGCCWLEKWMRGLKNDCR